MNYISYYLSPLGKLLLAAEEKHLTGVWFEGQKYFADKLTEKTAEKEIPLLTQTKHWMDIYFSGKAPDFTLPLKLTGTSFQTEVWEILKQIPYGETITYHSIAKKIAIKRGLIKMSAQAVGGAVGRNPISIIVPCHRVLGTNNALTGYAAGLDKKIQLLKLEGINTDRMTFSK